MGLDDPAEQHRYADISTASGFLRAVKEVIATDLAAEPMLRSYVRRYVLRWVAVTAAGEGAHQAKTGAGLVGVSWPMLHSYAHGSCPGAYGGL
jgi:hypothetical protein